MKEQESRLFRCLSLGLVVVLLLPNLYVVIGQECVRTFQEVQGPFAFKNRFVSQQGNIYGVGIELSVVDNSRNVSRFPIPGSWDLRATYFLDEHLGYVVGDKGTISVTRDGGRSWKLLDSTAKVDLNAINCVAANRCWAVGDSGTILFTNDGESWLQTRTLLEVDLFSVSFVSDRRGFAGGNDGKLYSSQDGGLTWQGVDRLPPQVAPRTEFDSVTWRSIQFFDEQFGCVSSEYHAVCTRDGGTTWFWPDFLENEKQGGLIGLAKIEKKAVFLGSCGTDFVTTNRGKSWSEFTKSANADEKRLAPNSFGCGAAQKESS